MRFLFVVLTVCFIAGLHAEQQVSENIALSVRVLPHKDECFFEEVNSAGTKVYLHFMVTTGAELDIDAAVYGPDNQLIWSGEREREGRILFKARIPGPHQFCFSNKMSRVTVKTVTFNIQVGDVGENHGHSTDPMERSILHVLQGLTEIKNEQNYLRTRERVHRDTAESTNTRVLFWSLAEIGIIVLAALGQLMYLKRCFERRRSNI